MEENNTAIRKTEDRMPDGAVVVLSTILFAAGIIVGHFAIQPERSQACELNSAAVIATAQAQKAQYDDQTAAQKRLNDTQLEVVHQCVAHGNIPVLGGGNVDCKPGLKAR